MLMMFNVVIAIGHGQSFNAAAIVARQIVVVVVVLIILISMANNFIVALVAALFISFSFLLLIVIVIVIVAAIRLIAFAACFLMMLLIVCGLFGVAQEASDGADAGHRGLIADLVLDQPTPDLIAEYGRTLLAIEFDLGLDFGRGQPRFAAPDRARLDAARFGVALQYLTHTSMAHL